MVPGMYKVCMVLATICLFLFADACERTEEGRSVPERKQVSKPAAHLAEQPNVIWIVIDALRADHVGAYDSTKKTTPFLDALAKRAVLFARAYSQESYTLASAASYFTSTFPPEHGVLYIHPRIDTLAPRFLTIAEVLRDAGYATAAFVFNPSLRARFGFQQGFDLYDDAREGLGEGPMHVRFETARRAYGKLEKYLQAEERRPIFLYVHYRDVHDPYVPPPPYHETFLPRGVAPIVDLLHETDLWKKDWPRFDRASVPVVLSQYDGEIHYTDEVIRQTFAMFASHGLTIENSLVIITADHGEEFFDPHPGDTGGSDHGRTLYVEQLRVPLLLLFPQEMVRARIVEEPVMLVDIAPTIADVAGIDPDRLTAFRGISLRPLASSSAPAPPRRTLYSGGHYRRAAIVEGKWKYYRYDKRMKVHERMVRPPADYEFDMGEELYDFEADPREQRDLAGEKTALVEELREDLARLLESMTGESSPPTESIDEATREQLRTLGYEK